MALGAAEVPEVRRGLSPSTAVKEDDPSAEAVLGVSGTKVDPNPSA